MKSIVIDSTVAVKWISYHREDDLEKADKILNDVKSGNIELLAPQFLKYEIGKMLFYGKKLTQLESKIVLDAFFHIPIKYISLDQDLAKEAHAIASAYNLTYSESVYLALAEEKKAVFVTGSDTVRYKDTEVEVVGLGEY